MKKLLLLAIGLVTSTISLAQNNIEATYINEIKLDYEETIKNIPQQFRSQFADAIKGEIEAGIFMTYHLKSNGKNSSFNLEQKINNSQSSGGFIAQQMSAMDNKPYYKDLLTTPPTYYKEVDLMGSKQFLIKESPNFNWKVTREKSEIAGYKVTKAEGVMMDSIKVTAWYAPEITVKDGPQTLSGLPGLIVKAEYEANNAKMIFTLKELKILDKELKVTIPTKGVVVSEKQFMEEMIKFQEKIKEMMNGGVDTE